MSQGTDIDSIKTVNEKPIKNTKFITATYNIGGIVAGIAALFFHNTNGDVILLLYPLLGVGIILLSKRAIQFTSNDNPQIFTSIYLGVLIPVTFIAFSSYDDFTLLQANNFWLPFVFISFIIAATFYKISVDPFDKKNRASTMFIFLVALAYGYGSTMQINCTLDHSDAQIYNSVVLSKHKHHGKHDAYYLTLNPWGPVRQIKNDEIDVSLYDEVKIGDTVKVNLRPGLLHAPWFVVTKN